MPSPLLIAALPAALAAAGALASTTVNAISQHRTNKLQIAENEKAFAREQAAVREQNVYNSPARQVARLAAAGLNPQLAYGNGDIVSSTQNDVPNYTPASLSAPQVDFGSVIQSSVLAREQFNKNSLAKSLSALQSAQALKETSADALNRIDLKFLTDTLGFREDSVKKSYELLVQEGTINDETIQKLRTENKIKTEILSQEEWNTLMSEGRFDMLMVELDMRKEEFNQLRELFPAKLAVLSSEAALNYVKSGECSANIAALTALKELRDSQSAEQRADTAAKDRNNRRNRKYEFESRDLGDVSLGVGKFRYRRKDYFGISKGFVSVATQPTYFSGGGSR